MFNGNTWFTFLIFTLIVVVAILGNSLVIYVLVVRRKKFLNKPYSVFILNLAIVDFLTAISLIVSRFLYLPATPTYNDTAAEAFCQTIWSGRFAFDLGYISVYTCVALTIERWFAVVKPNKYLSARSIHAVYAVIIVWFIGPAVNFTTYFRIKYNVDEKKCVWRPIAFAKEELPWIALALQSILPYTTIVLLYTHVYYTLKKLPRLTSNRDIQLRRITVVALLACSALIVGWMPGRITFMLTKFGHLDPNGSIHFTCVMITFLNSCVNPFLYGIYSPVFRAEYKKVFHYYYRKTVTVFRHSQVKPAPDGVQGNSNSRSGKAVSAREQGKASSLSVKAEYNEGYAFTIKSASEQSNQIALMQVPNLAGSANDESAKTAQTESVIAYSF